ncbi:MAG: WS/DGAT domain-containing protein [Acidobacteriota bacterium]
MSDQGLRDSDRLEPVAGRDGVWLQDTDTNLMVINGVMVTDRLRVEDLRRVWHERVMQAGGGDRYHRFRKSIVEHRGRPHWREVENFDLADHIFEVNDPALRTKEGLQEYIGRQASVPLPFDRPPWQLQVIPEFGDGGTVVLSRLHHVLGDGMALVPVIFSMMDTGGVPVEKAMARQQVKTRGMRGKVWQMGLKASLLGGPLLAARAVQRPDRSLVHGQELSGTKKVSWTRPLSLSRIKEAKNKLGATVNDVLMTCIAGGFRHYADGHPEEDIGRLRVSMPVNVRSPSETPKMENKFAAVIFELPVHLPDLGQRLEETKRRMDALKRSAEPMIYYGAVNVLVKALPQGASRGLVDFYARKCSAVLTNVPGPRDPLSIAGQDVRSMLFWVPQRANIGLGISIFSFSDEVRIGIISDVAVVAEPDDLVAEIEAELERLYAHG